MFVSFPVPETVSDLLVTQFMDTGTGSGIPDVSETRRCRATLRTEGLVDQDAE